MITFIFSFPNFCFLLNNLWILFHLYILFPLIESSAWINNALIIWLPRFEFCPSRLFLRAYDLTWEPRRHLVGSWPHGSHRHWRSLGYGLVSVQWGSMYHHWYPLSRNFYPSWDNHFWQLILQHFSFHLPSLSSSSSVDPLCSHASSWQQIQPPLARHARQIHPKKITNKIKPVFSEI